MGTNKISNLLGRISGYSEIQAGRVLGVIRKKMAKHVSDLRNKSGEFISEFEDGRKAAILSSEIDTQKKIIEENRRIAETAKNGRLVWGAGGKLFWGADIDARPKDENTPLMTVASEGYDLAVKLLWNGGADINALNGGGYNALHLTLKSGRDINFLNRQGLDARNLSLIEEVYQDINLNSLKHAAQHDGRLTVDHLVDTALLLINSGIDINSAENEYHTTPLMMAAGAGFVTVVEALLRAGAAVNQTNTSGKTALYYVDTELDTVKNAVLHAVKNKEKKWLNQQQSRLNEVREVLIKGGAKTGGGLEGPPSSSAWA